MAPVVAVEKGTGDKARMWLKGLEFLGESTTRSWTTALDRYHWASLAVSSYFDDDESQECPFYVDLSLNRKLMDGADF